MRGTRASSKNSQPLAGQEFLQVEASRETEVNFSDAEGFEL
jgi:hypothetical protein